jgi:hypothetical protein
MVGLTGLKSQSVADMVLKGVVLGVGGWCGWGLLKRRRQVILFAIGLCFYAIFGSVSWLYSSTLTPLFYGQETSFGWYDFLAVLYIVAGGIVAWFLLRRDTRQWFKD